MGKGLALSTMLYSDEVNSMDDLEELPGADAKPKERELEMAQQLIGSLTTTFEPEKYKDEHREHVLELIEKKAEGEEIVRAEAPAEPTRVVNLMEALEASIKSLKQEEKGERRVKAKAARTGRKGKKSA
jgi:DNA end-binding protein Ku